jgi:cytochrome c-type biogenesis protein
MGLVFSGIGNLLYQARDILEKTGGVIVVCLGLQMAGILRIPFLEHEFRPRSGIERNRGFISSFLMGILFSAGWSPCIGPILGTILVIAMDQGETAKGALLLSGYSLGMAIPFLSASVCIGWLTKIIKKYKRAIRIIEIINGFLLVLVGILLFFGKFDKLSGYGSLIQFGI